jgi:hypothetical protein
VWKHDLFKAANPTSAMNGTKGKEEILQFPPKKLTPEEKSQVTTLWKV